MPYMVGLTFEFVDEIVKCDNSNKIVLLSSIFLWYYVLVHPVLTFESVDPILGSI